jgi:hypothetical protein
MKEYTFTFKEGLTKGLRRFSNTPRNAQSLVELHNLAPSDLGIEPHEALISLDDTAAFGGIGAKAAITNTSDITIAIQDYVDSSVDIAGASVYIDDVLVGTTDANGEIDLTLTVGGHSIKVTAAGYVDSDTDDLLNDYFVVT